MSFNDLADKMRMNLYNPGSIYWDSIQALEENLGGVVIQNSTSPVMTLLAHTVVNGVINNEEVARLERMEAPEYASNFAELSRFIPYQELNLIYATPLASEIYFYIGLQDIMAHGVLEGNTRKVLIPKDTVITHSTGIKYGFHHDLMITLTENTVLDAVYVDNNNPLVDLVSPVVKANLRHPTGPDGVIGEPLVELVLDIYQFTKKTSLFPITSSIGFSKTIDLDDQYYHARVYSKLNGVWVELHTAFSDFNYNPHDTVATAVVKHLGSSIEVSIPYVYITRGLIQAEVKIEVYTTKGELSIDYSASLPAEFNIEIRNNDTAMAKYSAPLKSFKSVAAVSVAVTSGGRNLPDFEKTRAIVASANINAETITEAQLRTKLEIMGYKYIHQSNYLTENVYLASKGLKLMSSDGAEVLTLGGNIPILLQDLVDIHGVHVNGNNRTITPDAIMELDNGHSRLLTESEGLAIKALNKALTVEVTNSRSLLSPVFHHVLETSDGTNAIRIYDLSVPRLLRRSFIGINSNASGSISIEGVTIVKTASGYTLVISALATTDYSGLPNSSWVAQLNGVGYNGLKVAMNHESLIKDSDGKFVFTFPLDANYDLRDKMGIRFTNLTGVYGDLAFLELITKFTLAFVLVNDLPVVEDSNWHAEVDSSKLPNKFQVVGLEDLTVQLGTQLDTLYRPARSIAGQETFMTYDANVMDYWEEDVPEVDEDNYVIFNDNPDYNPSLPSGPDNPAFLYPVKFRKGDPVVIDGVHQVKHLAGTAILDKVTNKPIPTGKTSVSIETSLVVGDYRLKVAGIAQSTLSNAIVKSLDTDIAPLIPKTIQLSKLYYDVARSVGTTTVRLDADTSRTIRKDLSFVYDVVVDAVTYKDAAVRALIKKQIKNTTASVINGTNRYVENELISSISAILGKTVLGFKLVSINGMSDLVTFSLVNEYDYIGVAPILYLNTAGQLAINDDITVNFVLDQ